MFCALAQMTLPSALPVLPKFAEHLSTRAKDVVLGLSPPVRETLLAVKANALALLRNLHGEKQVRLPCSVTKCMPCCSEVPISTEIDCYCCSVWVQAHKTQCKTCQKCFCFAETVEAGYTGVDNMRMQGGLLLRNEVLGHAKVS